MPTDKESAAEKTAASANRASLAEFTWQAVITGLVLGVVFGAANAYLGLRAGMTVSASIPAAVMTVAVFALMGRKATILEANMSQTIASASTALATGSIYTLPAVFLWGIIPPYMQIVALCFLGGLLGLAAMIPLRRLLIVQSHDELPYPEGTACAEVLMATTKGVSGAGWVFAGMAVAAGVKLITDVFFVVPGELELPLHFLPKAELGMELSPAIIAVGFLLGYRNSAVCVSGSLLSWLVFIPLIYWLGEGLTGPIAPATTKLISEMSSNDIWKTYVRCIGAGAVATAGIIAVLQGMPSMFAAFVSVARGMRANKRAKQFSNDDQNDADRTDRDLPGTFIFAAIAVVVLAPALVPGILGGDVGFLQRTICAGGIALFGLLFVTVTARIVGLVGVSSQPTSGIALVTLLGVASLFAAVGWTDLKSQAAVLTVGTIVAIAASKSGDISQDLKTGFLVGATPARQQFGQFLGAATACWAVAGTLLLLSQAYEFGSESLPAPQATLMKTIVEGVFSGQLPWRLVYSGAGAAICGMLLGANGLAFGIGVYLPLSTMMPMYVGGCVRALVDYTRRGRPVGESDTGVLAASGLVAGEGLAGVLLAGLVAAHKIDKDKEPLLAKLHWTGQTGVAVLALMICVFLWWACRTKSNENG
jgi:putative OPT family oligopeptide transporter